MMPVVVRGDARRLPLPAASVDLVVTSPPYFALRSYTDGGAHYASQIGSEPTPAEYIAALVECTREWVRVLKPSGSLFINLGDKYQGSGSGPRSSPMAHQGRSSIEPFGQRRSWTAESPNKSLMLLPERYRIACVDQLGLIARAVLVWSKPNGLPESVTDRVRRSHEDWVHLTRSPRYFAAVDEIREPHNPNTHARGKNGATERDGVSLPTWGINGTQSLRGVDKRYLKDPLGKLPGSVWEVATEPLKVPERLGVDHFAAFPSEWPRRLILGWSPSGVCTACGEGRRPVTQERPDTRKPYATVGVERRTPTGGMQSTLQKVLREDGTGGDLARKERTITGYACACTPYTDHPGTGETANRRDYDPSVRGNHQQGDYGRKQAGEYERCGPWREYHFDRWTPAPTRPSVCLDPFGGTGTTAHVAVALGRVGITVDLSADYCRLAAAPELLHQRRRKVLGLEPPPKPVAGPDQFDLFAEEVS